MKGLLIKNYYEVRRYALIMLGMGTLFVLLGALSTEEQSVFISLFLFVYVGVLPCTALNLEEKSHWEQYTAMLPYTRTQLVLEKYLLGVINIAGASIIYVALNGILAALHVGKIDASYVMMTLTSGVSMGLLMPALSLPWMFALGGAKGRIFMLITVGAIGGTLGALVGAGSTESIIRLLSRLGGKAYWLLLLIVAAILGLSMLISITAYRKREL